MSANHVHPNPGFSDYERNIRRSARVPELLSSKEYSSGRDLPCPMAELSQIKEWSKRAWSANDRSETTYQFQYCPKELDERTPSAPTEKGRLNKPHPKEMFLTNRLHYVPGYHNADTAIGKSPYLPDSLCDKDEQSYRVGLKSKYDGGISDAAVRQYADKDESDFTKWNRTLPPNDSWMAASSPYGERSRIQRALDARPNMDKVPNMMIPQKSKGTLGSNHQTDKSNVQGNPNKPLYRFPRPRGDFLIHPVWPPSIWHHRIPGFRADPPANGVLSVYDRHQQKRLAGVY
ncbi:uncharacterized protein [Watersipora subatra]|uniref:uncharacterized protein n=1 Tax=Watersipora subatra TaxID=2589382 RepID=UPI00355C1DBE